MRKNLKKFIAIVLTVVMVAGIVPVIPLTGGEPIAMAAEQDSFSGVESFERDSNVPSFITYDGVVDVTSLKGAGVLRINGASGYSEALFGVSGLSNPHISLIVAFSNPDAKYGITLGDVILNADKGVLLSGKTEIIPSIEKDTFYKIDIYTDLASGQAVIYANDVKKATASVTGTYNVTLSANGGYLYTDSIEAEETPVKYDSAASSVALNGGSASAEYGVGGKPAYDASVKAETVSTTGTSNVYYRSTNFDISEAAVYSIEANVLPVSNVENFIFATQAHTPVSGYITGFEVGQWIKLQCVINTATKEWFTYVNGVALASGNISTNASNYIIGKSNEFRIVVNKPATETEEKAVVYFDDMCVRRLDDVAFDMPAYAPANTTEYIVEDGVITGNATASSLAVSAGDNVRTYFYADDTFTPLDTDRITSLPNDSVVVFVNEDDVYSSYKISSSTVVTELSSGFAKGNFPNGGSFESVYGFGGRLSSDESAHVYGPCSDNNTFYTTGSFTLDTEKTYILEGSFYPVSGVKHMYIGTKSHARLSLELKENDLILNQWNRIHYVYFPQSGKGALYLNGNFKGYYVVADSAKTSMETSGEIRLIAYQKSTDGLEIYFDDIRMLTSKAMPAYTPFELDTDGSALAYADNSAAVMYICDNTTASDLNNEIGAMKNCTIGATDADGNCIEGAISDGDIIACRSQSGIFAYYTAKIWDDSRLLSDGDYVLAKGAPGAMLIAAKYDSTGALTKLDIDRNDDSDKAEVLSLMTAPDDSTTMKVMLWDGTHNLKPLAADKNYAVSTQAKPSILVVGSEYGMDAAAYLKDIATSAGLDIGVGILYHDDADFAAQYNSVADSQYNAFVYDGVSMGNYSFDDVAANPDYRWDYVVLNSAVTSYYSSIDSSEYQSGITSLVEYVNTKLPDANIAVMQPVVNQVGYCYTDGDSTVAVTASNQTEMTDWLYTQTNTAVNTAAVNVGKHITLVPAGSIFKSVLDKADFNSTYNKSAHDALVNNQYVGIGLFNGSDTGEITLYRDGTHASPAGRFVLGTALLKAITGYTVNPDGYNLYSNIPLDCDRYTGDETITCIFDYPDDKIEHKLVKAIVSHFEGYMVVTTTSDKSDGFRDKSDAETVMLESFDDYSGKEIGNGWYISSNGNTFSAVSDQNCGGNYLEFSKASTTNKLEATKFFDPAGGSMRVDLQFSLFDAATDVTMALYTFNYSDDANEVTSIAIKGSKLYALGNSTSTELATLSTDTWYNLSLYLYADTYTYNVMLNGSMVGENIAYNMNIRTLSAFKIVSAAGNAANMGIDNMRVSYITSSEYNNTATVASDDGVLLNETFEADGAYGSLASGTSITDTANKTGGDITYQHDGSNGYLKATRTVADSGTCSVHIPFKSTTEDVKFECKVRINDTKSSFKLMTIYSGGYAYTYYFNYDSSLFGSKLTLYSYQDNGSGSPTGVARAKRLTSGRWYDLKVETHNSSGTYDLTFNGTKYSNIPAQTSSGASSQFRFAITTGAASSYDIDNVVVNEVPITYDGYNPDATGAPEMYAWQDTYMSAPSGIVVNAEDMTLDNFAVAEDAIFHGSKGATVSGWGAGSAKFTFDGESGYYAINVGYKESEGKYDSFYEFNQNDKRIDWWIGQYDDGQRHVRKSKTYHYIENGDEFEIIGAYGSDPSSLDYVEFIESDIPEFTFGDLIDDASSAHPSYWLDSSWVGEEEGGYVRYGHTIHDARSDAKSAAIRNFYPTAKSLSLDFTFKPSALNTTFDMTIGDRTSDALSVRFSGGKVTSGNVSKASAYTTSSQYARLVVNREDDTFSLYINSNPALENVPLKAGMGKLNVLKFATTDAGKGTLTLSNLRMNAGLVLDESFRAMASGSTPEFAGWTVSNASVSVMRSENPDSNSLKLTTGGTAQKDITVNSSVVTFETNFIIPTKKDGVKLNIGSDSGYIGLYTKGDNIYYDNGDGNTANDEVVWSGYLDNIWYSASIVADLESKTASFAVNDFSKKENIAISIGEINKVSYESGSAEGELWLDDIKVFNGTYACEVPEPQVAQSDYRVVMEACDLWREGHHFGNDSMVPYDNRTPFLGYLEDGNPEVADWETKFLVEHGINTYATCWYINANWNGSPVKTPRNSAKLNVGYMKSKYADKLDFAILVTTIGGNYGVDAFLEHQVRYWIERYFRSPNYWKVDGRPVIPVFDVNALKNLDASLFDKIDALLAEHGFENGAIYIGTHNNGVTTTANGYDYKYQYHQSSSYDAGHMVIQSLLTKQSTDSVKMLASPSQGWGNEAWGRADRKLNVPLDEWQASLEWIKNVYMPQQKAADSTSLSGNTLWLGNWNEYSEGHFLAPSNISGFGYLDAVRKVFTDASDEHTDTVPTKQFDQLTAVRYR